MGNHLRRDIERLKETVDTLTKERAALKQMVQALEYLIRRTGAWQDKNGEWVYGQDAVQCVIEMDGSDKCVAMTRAACDVYPKDRKYYAKVSSAKEGKP